MIRVQRLEAEGDQTKASCGDTAIGRARHAGGDGRREPLSCKDGLVRAARLVAGRRHWLSGAGERGAWTGRVDREAASRRASGGWGER